MNGSKNKIIDLFLLRHAESEANTNRSVIGGKATKTPLTKLGEQQAQALGYTLCAYDIAFDRVYSSTATRAMQTAVLALKETRMPTLKDIETHEELEELGQGLWEGAVRKEVYNPEVMKQVKANLLDYKAPAGESQREVGERINNFIHKNVLTNEPPMTIGIFFHGLAIRCWLRTIMDFDPKFIFPMEIDNCSITRIQYDITTKLWAIKCINFSHSALK